MATFDPLSKTDVFDLLSRFAGVGLWDAIIVDGVPFGAGSRWTWSDEFRRLLDYTDRTDFPDVAASWLDSLHPDDHAPTMAAVGKAIDSSETIAGYESKYRLRRKAGDYRWFRAVGVVVHDAAGMAVRACGSLIDVHEEETVSSHAKAQGEIEMKRLETISGRIRLIALNALIEASRFGSEGAAFGVVAQEIKSLSSEIDYLIDRIRNDISMA